jgi:NADH-quinone oxidoreductase subunit H
MFIHPEVQIINGEAVYGFGVALGTALIQLLVLLVKAVFFCWVWIWVRWTLPRFRYDHVMHLGWKILLNIAILNLVVTAIAAKLLGGN